MSKLGSYYYPASTEPRYPVNAVFPQNDSEGHEIGENAETD